MVAAGVLDSGWQVRRALLVPSALKEKRNSRKIACELTGTKSVDESKTSMTNRIYYTIKPFIPRKLRLLARRSFARRKLARFKNVWPIDPNSARPPVGWPGWPGKKDFALILTHDVEGQRGLERVRQLADVELSMGFRSSFNFVPEGDYRTPDELRTSLTKDGFEVGVHDWKHDGKLFRSRSNFDKGCPRINKWLKDWDAVGFRGGFMIRNLSWIGELDIQYDASTFDTDPFEPMPNGAGTIFPYWIPRAKGGGYVELPYSLPQDSTLFFLLGEKSPEIWMRKLEWVAENGGMALINVHPDYTYFGGGAVEFGQFPVQHYVDLLDFAKTRFGDRFWHATPREVSKYCESFRPLRAQDRPKRVCVVGYTFYEFDNRVRRYAEALAERGDKVEVVALRRGIEDEAPKVIKGVTSYTLQHRAKNEKSKLAYFFRLARFLISSGFFLARASRQNPYDVIHVHNVPDFLVFATLIPKLKGSKVILDIHDLVPEFYASKFSVAETSRIVTTLKLIEKWACNFADHVIISNHLWHEKITARSVHPSRCSTYINNVDMDLFYPRMRTRQDNKFIIFFPGGLQWHQGLDIAIRAFHIIAEKAPMAELHICGEGDQLPALKALVKDLGLEHRVLFSPLRPVKEIPQLMADSDLGVVPKRANSFGNEAYSTKIMEFMAQGVPLVVSRTQIDSYYFNDQVVRFFESGNIEDLADGMLTLIRSRALRESLTKNGLEYAAKNSWASQKINYLSLVDSLTA